MRSFIAACQLALLAGLLAFLVTSPADAASITQGRTAKARDDVQMNEGGGATSEAVLPNLSSTEEIPQRSKDDSDLSTTKTNQESRETSGNPITQTVRKVQNLAGKAPLLSLGTNDDGDDTTEMSSSHPLNDEEISKSSKESNEKPGNPMAQIVGNVQDLAGKAPLHSLGTNDDGDDTTETSSSHPLNDDESSKSTNESNEKPRNRMAQIVRKLQDLAGKALLSLGTNEGGDDTAKTSSSNPLSDEESSKSSKESHEKPRNPFKQLLDQMRRLRSKLPKF